jgi:Protein of unknown function (DUF4231)
MVSTDDPRLALIDKRIDDCVNFYKSQSDLYRRIYFTLNGVQIVAASLVPILALALVGDAAKVAAAIAGAVVAIAKGLDSLGKSRENWVRDVDTRNALLSERSQFEMRAGGYAGAADGIALLSSRIEGLMAAERVVWSTVEKPSEEDKA